MSRRPLSLAVAAALTAGLAFGPAIPSFAAPAAGSVKVFANCTAIRKVYSGGIAKQGVKFNTTHYRGQVHHRALKGNVKFSTPLYLANRKSDADHDGIACEKS